MKRFKFEHWVDFVRGVAPAGQADAMADALARGDAASQRLHELARSVADAAPWVSGPDAPRDVVQRAVSIFTPTSVESALLFPSLAASLLFDSRWSMQTAGLRAQAAAHREVVHQAGDFRIQLRMEQETGTEVLALVGQVVPSAEPLTAVANRPVLVFQKDKLVARTLSSVQGEFQMEFLGRQPLRLVLTLGAPDRRVELDL